MNGILVPHSQPPASDGDARHPYHSKIVSFAPRSTRLKYRQEKVWEEMAPTYVITPERIIARASISPDEVFDPATTFGRSAPLIVEIGSGQGECAEHASGQNPGTNFLAIEVYLPGIASTLVKIRRSELENLRVLQADAAEAFDTYLPAQCAAEVWTFFPDPWHKSRHNKRRLVRPEFVPKVAAVLAPGGTWRLATDWLDYAEQMAEVIEASPYFELVSNDTRFEGRILTSFEKKGMAKDRIITDLAYRRTDVPVATEVAETVDAD